MSVAHPHTPRETYGDRDWLLRCYRGDIQNEAAFRAVAVARACPELMTPEATAALIEGDRLYPDDDRRYTIVDLGPPPVESDPGTNAAFDELVASRPDPIGDMFVDWTEFFTKTRDDGDDWTIDDVLARGRGHSIFAKGKTGKSELVLRLVVDHVTSPANTDVAVVFDYEMGDADLYQRLVEDFGYSSETDFARLRYAQLPTIPPLDTPGGADTIDMILAWVEQQHPGAHVIVVIDTIGRAVEGPENENDTILRFYRHTGSVLRRHEATWARLDHTGHENSDRARGGSAKLDDIDIAWELKRTDDGTELVRRASRLSWVPERVAFIRAIEPTVTYTRVPGSWPAGTADVARRLNALGVDVTAGRRAAGDALREDGWKGRNEVVAAAQRYRKSALYPSVSQAHKRSGTASGPGPGTTNGDHSPKPPLTSGDQGGDHRGPLLGGAGDQGPPLEGGPLVPPGPNGLDPRIDTDPW